MESMKFNDYFEFAKYIYRLAESGKAVSVVAFGNEISIIAKILLAQHEITLGFINDFDNSDYTDYDREYYLAVDPDMSLSIERVFGDDDRIMKSGLDVGCYMSDVRSKIALTNEDDVQYEIEILKDCCDTCGCALDDGYSNEEYDEYEDYCDDDDDDDALILTEEDTPVMLYMICEMLDELLDELKK